MGAVCIESGPIAFDEEGNAELEDLTSLGTFTLRDDRLDFSGISEERMIAALELVKRRLGNWVSTPTRCVRSIEDARPAVSAMRSLVRSVRVARR